MQLDDKCLEGLLQAKESQVSSLHKITQGARAFVLPNQEAATVANKLVDEVFLRFSVPEQLHIDQGQQFESQLMHKVCKLLNIHKTRAMPYYPHSDRLVERFNWTLLSMLSRHPQATPHFTSCLGARHNSQWISFTDPHAQIHNLFHHLPVLMHHNCRTAYSQLLTWLETIPHASWMTKGILWPEGVWQTLHTRRFSTCQFPRKEYHVNFITLGLAPLKLWKRSDVTYRIQKQQGKRLQKIVHFDRLKPCSCNIQSKLNSNQSPATTEDPTAHQDTHGPVIHTFGNHTELLDEDDENACNATPLQVTGHEPPVRRYPTREWRPPRHLDD